MESLHKKAIPDSPRQNSRSFPEEREKIALLAALAVSFSAGAALASGEPDAGPPAGAPVRTPSALGQPGERIRPPTKEEIEAAAGASKCVVPGRPDCPPGKKEGGEPGGKKVEKKTEASPREAPCPAGTVVNVNVYCPGAEAKVSPPPPSTGEGQAPPRRPDTEPPPPRAEAPAEPPPEPSPAPRERERIIIHEEGGPPSAKDTGQLEEGKKPVLSLSAALTVAASTQREAPHASGFGGSLEGKIEFTRDLYAVLGLSSHRRGKNAQNPEPLPRGLRPIPSAPFHEVCGGLEFQHEVSERTRLAVAAALCGEYAPKVVFADGSPGVLPDEGLGLSGRALAGVQYDFSKKGTGKTRFGIRADLIGENGTHPHAGLVGGRIGFVVTRL